MSKNKNLISITGRIGNGKDEIGSMIQYLTSKADEKYTYQKYKEIYSSLGEFGIGYLPEFEIKKFADKLKEITCLLLGCERSQLENRIFKESELGEEWRIWKYGNKIYNNYEDAKTNLVSDYWYISTYEEIEKLCRGYITTYLPTPRLFLQLIGTECFRSIIHPNSWVNATFAKYNANEDMWILTDTRFPNELERVRQLDGITIKVVRKSVIIPQNEHESEYALDNATFDYIIENDGSLDDLLSKVKEILIKEEII